MNSILQQYVLLTEFLGHALGPDYEIQYFLYRKIELNFKHFRDFFDLRIFSSE